MEFIKEVIARGSWWAVLSAVLFIIPFGIIGGLVGKKSKSLQSLITLVPGVVFVFYIWNIRKQVSWLILAIIGVIGVLFTLYIIFIQILVLIIKFSVKKFYLANKELFDEIGTSILNGIKNVMPVFLDYAIKLDKTIVINNVIQYHYIVQTDTDPEDYNQEIKNKLNSYHLNKIKTIPELQELKKNKVTIEYVYHNENNIEILKFTYKYKDYSDDSMVSVAKLP